MGFQCAVQPTAAFTIFPARPAELQHYRHHHHYLPVVMACQRCYAQRTFYDCHRSPAISNGFLHFIRAKCVATFVTVFIHPRVSTADAAAAAAPGGCISLPKWVYIWCFLYFVRVCIVMCVRALRYALWQRVISVPMSFWKMSLHCTGQMTNEMTQNGMEWIENRLSWQRSGLGRRR